VTSARALRIDGPVLTSRDEQRDGAWILDGKITFERPRHLGSDHDADVVTGWAIPGLVDAHCHIGLVKDGATTPGVQEVQAVTDRDSGVLLIRDAGSAADTRWIDDRDDLPQIIRAGRHIARTKRYIRNFAHEVEPIDLVATVRQEAARGDGWVKLVGDWIDRSTGDLAPCWPPDALAAAIAAAHELGARVTAHCFGEDCLPDLLNAGIDCIEHASGLTGSTLDLAVSKGVAIVPTLINIATFPQIAAPAQERFPLYYRHMLDLHATRFSHVAAAYESGVPIYCGTDAGGSLAHGLVPKEVAELVASGLPALAALDAACWSARSWLGRPALDEGASADLVIYPADPRLDVAVLAHPVAVVLRGSIFAGAAGTPGPADEMIPG
jgi:imidazolonepropionase-like amidohydrolase